MSSKERVAAALRCEQPDRVPHCELHVDRALAQKIMGWQETNSQEANLEANVYSLEEAKSVASHLRLDNISYVLRAPVYAQKLPGRDGRLFYGEGMIKSVADLAKVDLPDPFEDSLYQEAAEFTSRKEDYSAWFVTRAGIFPTMLSMGLQHFCAALYEDPGLVESLLDRYFEWALVVAERVCNLGFDVFVSTDDLAFKSGPFFSPQIFHDLLLPRYHQLAERITIPWIIHSDGNIMPFLTDLLSLGIVGLHPNEKGAVDIRRMKKQYGDRICLLGNVDLNLLGLGSPEQVDREVYELIRDVGPGGGYVLTSGNSLAGYLQPSNVLAMVEAVQKYGRYPLGL
jgi:uroporphyrinogen decarboxylase